MFQPWHVGLKRRLVGATCIRLKPCASVLYAPNEAARRGGQGKARADVAQLVEHHLAKVRVASSNLVVRSETYSTRWSGREARQRTANPCTRVRIPSPPRAVGAVVARFLDTEEVASSNLASPTNTPESLGREDRPYSVKWHP